MAAVYKAYYYHFDGLGSVIALTRIANFMGRLIDFFKRFKHFGEPSEWYVEFSNIGFFLTLTHYPFCYKRKIKSMSWKDTKEIYTEIYDCFTCYPFSLTFVDFNDKCIRVEDQFEGWKLFFAEVLKRYPTFNLNNYKKVEASFPRRVTLLCWRFDKQVEDMDISTLGS